MAQSKARFLSSLLTSAGFVKDNRSLLAGSDGEIDLSSLPIIPNSQLEFSSVTLNELQVALGESDQLRTDDIPEGNVNLYYNTILFDSDFDVRFTTKSTTDLTEGDNLYYTSLRADSDAKNAISGGTGLTYNPATGVLDITDTGVSSGSYGSASLVPTLSVNAQGQIDSIGTVSVAGVSSIDFDSVNGNFTINTADGGSFVETITLDPFTTDLDNTYVNTAGDTMTGFLTLHADPVNAFHAVTKEYADNLAQGVKTAPSVRAATTTNLDATYDSGVNGVGATLTSTSNGGLPLIDGVDSWEVNNGILVKDQTILAENGRYFVNDVGNDSNPWVLERCEFCDEDSEIPGAYVFVQEGTEYEGTGWIQIVEDPNTFTVGADSIVVTQFSGAGTFVAGDGIDLTNNVFSIDSNELSTIIQNIDGAGSGIDADLLDGQEGSHYRINVYDANGILQN